MAALEFINNDQEYQEWIKHHQGGFVINTPKSKPIHYMALHSAKCRLISQYTKKVHPGGYTEKNYIKICADSIYELQEWIKNNGNPSGRFSGICTVCNPSE